MNNNNSSSYFRLRSSSCRTDLSIHFQPSRHILSECFFSYPYAVFSTFYFETDHRECEMTLGGWHCGLRLFKLGRLLHTGFEPRSLAWLACSTGQSATTYTTVAAGPYESQEYNLVSFICVYHSDHLYEKFQAWIKIVGQVAVQGPYWDLHGFYVARSRRTGCLGNG